MPKLRSPKRKSRKRSPKRKSRAPKRKSPKRKSPKRKSRKRSPKRKSRAPKRKSPKRKSRAPKRKSRFHNLACNKPQKSWRPGKKQVVRACAGGRERIVHFGATGYGHNYSPAARRSFRARHRCDTAKDKLTPRYWACKNLWTRGGSSQPCPSGRKCKQ